MHDFACTNRGSGEPGTSTIEAVGLALGVALLIAVLGPGLGAWGGTAGARDVGAALERGIVGAPEGGAVRSVRVRREGAHIRSVGDGVGDDLQLRPIGTPWAAVQRAVGWQWGSDHVAHRAHADWCIACAGIAQRSHASVGAMGQTSRDVGARGIASGGEGLGLHGRLQAYVAALAASARYAVTLRGAGAEGRAQAQASAAVGLESAAHGTLRLGHESQQLDVGGSAVAGATARGEARASIELAGIALQATGGAEGWAGVGATGRVQVRRTGGALTVGLRGGAAFGLGGAADASATIDVSEMAPQSRRALQANAPTMLGMFVPGSSSAARLLAIAITRTSHLAGAER